MAVRNSSGEQDYKLTFNRKKKEINNEIVHVFRKNCLEHYRQLRLRYADKETYFFKSATDDEKVQCLGKTIDKMEQALNREQIKIAVFGRTSSGKSTTLNAVLGEKLLRTGCGCTTKCVTQIMRSNDHIPRLITDDGKDNSYSCTKDLGRYLAVTKLDSCREMKIYLPNDAQCAVLEENIVLIDMPGTDYHESLDDLVKKHCFDCDVFLLIVSSESGLGYGTRNYYVNLFKDAPLYTFYVVFNKWDIMIEDAKQQIDPQDYEKDKRSECMHDAKRFLEAIFNHKNISVNSLENFVYFLSTTKAFADKLNKKHTLDSQNFERFVARLLNSGSHTALQRKLQYHKSSILKMMSKDFKENMLGKDILDCEKTIRNLQNTLDQRNEVLEAVKRKIQAGKKDLLRKSKLRLERLIEQVIKVIEAQKNVASRGKSADEYYYYILDDCGVRSLIRSALEGLNDLYKGYKNEVMTKMLEFINNLDDSMGLNDHCTEEDKQGEPCANAPEPRQEAARNTMSSSPTVAQIDKDMFLKDVQQQMKNIMVGLDIDEGQFGISKQEFVDEFDEIIASNSDECCGWLADLFNAHEKNESIKDSIKRKLVNMFNNKTTRGIALDKFLSDSFNIFCGKIEYICKTSLRLEYIHKSIDKLLDIKSELINIRAKCDSCERKLNLMLQC